MKTEFLETKRNDNKLKAKQRNANKRLELNENNATPGKIKRGYLTERKSNKNKVTENQIK